MFSSFASAHSSSQNHANASNPFVVSHSTAHIVETRGDSGRMEIESNSDSDDTSQDTTTRTQVNDSTINSSWRQELAAFKVGRNSQASSIFSTRTPLTVQSDDARSINIEAGGQSFRISRDGSHITNTTAPPPYPGPPLEDLTEDSEEEDGSSFYASRTSIDTVRNEMSESTTTPSLPDHSLPLRTHVPAESVESSPESRQTGYSLPRLLRSAIQARWYGNGTSTSPSSSRHPDPAVNDYLRSRSDLRRTQSESSGMPRLRSSQSFPSWPIDSGQEEVMSSPFLDAERQMQDIDWNDSHVSLDKQDDSSAEISGYYNRIMRDMDREHRKRLHERDSELARLRELLNEKDIVYRQQLRERDHVISGLNDKVSYRDVTINELKKNTYNLENDMQMRLERAKNEIEVR